MAQLGDDRRPMNPVLAPAVGDVLDPVTGIKLARVVGTRLEKAQPELVSLEPQGDLDPITGVPIAIDPLPVEEKV